MKESGIVLQENHLRTARPDSKKLLQIAVKNDFKADVIPAVDGCFLTRRLIRDAISSWIYTPDTGVNMSAQSPSVNTTVPSVARTRATKEVSFGGKEFSQIAITIA